MRAYWVKFADRRPGCIEAEDVDAAIEAAKAHGDPLGCEILPYPADPRLGEVALYRGQPCPSFCYTPNRCAGGTYCKKRPSCTS